jgi:hypothetical protein
MRGAGNHPGRAVPSTVAPPPYRGAMDHCGDHSAEVVRAEPGACRRVAIRPAAHRGRHPYELPGARAMGVRGMVGRRRICLWSCERHVEDLRTCGPSGSRGLGAQPATGTGSWIQRG